MRINFVLTIIYYSFTAINNSYGARKENYKKWRKTIKSDF